ncbi:MAG: hypothetical protein M3P22_00615 [bacterium]|nr:hypothetical protein [bacterium]
MQNYNIRIRNILMGLGISSIFLVVTLLFFNIMGFGLTNLDREDSITASLSQTESSTTNSEINLICPIDEYFFTKILTQDTTGSIDLDKLGNIFKIASLADGFSKFDQFGGNWSYNKLHIIHPPDQTLPGFFIDKDADRLYVSGGSTRFKTNDNDYQYLYIFNTIDETLIKRIDGTYALSVVAGGGYFYTIGIPSINLLRKYDSNTYALIQPSVALPAVTSFDTYSDLALYGNSIYILYKDTKTETSQVLKYNTTNLASEAGFDTGFAIDDAQRITTDSLGNIYVVGLVAGKVVIKQFDANGKFLRKLVVPDKYNLAAGIKVDIAVGEDGTIFLSGHQSVIKSSHLCGQISIEKNADPKRPESFNFSKDFLDKKDFTLVDDGTPDNTANKTTFNIWDNFDKEKIFQVEEKADKDYKTSWSCDGANPTIDNALRTKINDITGKASCTFWNKKVNTDTGTITIIKYTKPKSTQEFLFYLSWLDGADLSFVDDGTLGNTKNKKTYTTQTGIKTIGERDNHDSSKYDTEITCYDNTGKVLVDKLRKKTVEVTLEKDQNITCVFTNTSKSLIGDPR